MNFPFLGTKKVNIHISKNSLLKGNVNKKIKLSIRRILHPFHDKGKVFG